MKLFRLISVFAISVLCVVSCGGDDPAGGDNSGEGGSNGKQCESTFDCPLGYTCDTEKKICTNGSDDEGGNSGGNNGGGSSSGGNGDGGSSSGGNGNGGNSSGGNEDQGPITGNCTPGDTQKCEYQGASGTEGIGPCKAAMRDCKDDETWGPCEGEVLPVNEIGDELCSNGIDDDCNGVIDDGTDFDKDGHGACTDCCETDQQCPIPSEAWDKTNSSHACTYGGEEIVENCDSEISASSTNAMDYAKAIGLCKTTTEDSDDWGVISADISTPNDITNKNVHTGSHALVSKFGNSIESTSSNYMLALTSGKISNNTFQMYEYQGKKSGAPSDWLAKHNNKFPSAPVCNKEYSDLNANEVDIKDAVMLTLKIRTPKTAKSFSFNIYFLSKEYSTYVCSKFNDFFIALLNSDYTSTDPNLKNPDDMNLAMDANGNPVGVNLAPAGLFTQCKKQSSISNTYGTFDATSCEGTTDLQGTGFESNGGTGWLTTRGNVKGGEVITLRLAIWDLGDDRYDSLVLIKNFKWETTEQKPGTGQY